MQQQTLFGGVRDTSCAAYYDQRANGNTGSQQLRILNKLRKLKRAMTRQELSRATRIPINAICGRVNELIKTGEVIEGDKRHCSVTGRVVYELRLP